MVNLKHFQTTKALTLVELIASTIIIAIVMVGVVSVELAIRGMREGTSRNAIVAMRTSTVMLDISKRASLASGRELDPGISDESVFDTTLCIRCEDPFDPSPPLTPEDYTDDIITCYTWDAVSYDILSCQGAWQECPVGSTIIGTATAFTFTIPSRANPFLEITIVNRFDPSLAADTQQNPEYTLTSSISPAMHSF